MDQVADFLDDMMARDDAFTLMLHSHNNGSSEVAVMEVFRDGIRVRVIGSGKIAFVMFAGIASFEVLEQ